jgi:two-component system sensor histidine kinase/response regulator
LPGAAGRTPVIALTAHALVEVRERCIAAGFDQFLTKPVRVDELADVVEAATSTRATARPETASDTLAKPPLFEIGQLRDQFTSISSADLRRIIDRYGTELDQQLAILTGEGEEISPHHLRRIVHLLSGSSSMIGARRLGSLAGQLDALATQHADAQLTDSVNELVTTIRETREAVEAAKRDLEAAPA